MILDVEPSPKSPRSPVSTTSSPTEGSFFQHPHSHVSYSTFTSSSSQWHPPNTTIPASDVTSLLARDRGLPPINDELPPSYDEVRAQSKPRSDKNRFWTRLAGVGLLAFLIYSTWISYDQYTHKNPIPSPSQPSHSIPSYSDKYPSTTNPVRPTPSPTEAPKPPNLPPPKNETTVPMEPYVRPISGRDDLCRSWAYSFDSYSASSSLRSGVDKRPIDRLVYTVPTLAPIHIETGAICPGKNGKSEPCARYEGARDAITGKLHVVGGDVDKPRIDVSFQHGSEVGSEAASVCLVRRPRERDEKSFTGEDYKWVLGVYIWKSPYIPGGSGVFASLNINVILPVSGEHDFSTQLSFFSQIIGPTPGTDSSQVTFKTLQLSGEFGDTLVQNLEASVIRAVSSENMVEVRDSRISKILDLRSQVGHVGCNVTLAHRPEDTPVTANLQSDAGTVSGVFDLKYPSNIRSPQFDLTAYSRYGRAMLFVTDHQGTVSLRNNSLPGILPTLDVNLTSWYASTQLLVPPTFHGSMELSSRYAAIVTNDHAANLTARTVH